MTPKDRIDPKDILGMARRKYSADKLLQLLQWKEEHLPSDCGPTILQDPALSTSSLPVQEAQGSC